MMNTYFMQEQKLKMDKYLAIGGRVLNIIAITENFKNSKDKAIKILNDLDWKGGFFRKDIAYKVIKYENNWWKI